MTSEVDEFEREWTARGAAFRRGTKGSVLAIDFASAIADSPTWSSLAGLGSRYPKLRELRLDRCGASAATIAAALEGMQEGLDVSLAETAADESVLETAAKLPKLRLLDLTGTPIDEATLARWRKRMIRTRLVRRDRA